MSLWATLDIKPARRTGGQRDRWRGKLREGRRGEEEWRRRGKEERKRGEGRRGGREEGKRIRRGDDRQSSHVEQELGLGANCSRCD
jgi:hypothetical protein